MGRRGFGDEGQLMPTLPAVSWMPWAGRQWGLASPLSVLQGGGIASQHPGRAATSLHLLPRNNAVSCQACQACHVAKEENIARRDNTSMAQVFNCALGRENLKKNYAFEFLPPAQTHITLSPQLPAPRSPSGRGAHTHTHVQPHAHSEGVQQAALARQASHLQRNEADLHNKVLFRTRSDTQT